MEEKIARLDEKHTALEKRVDGLQQSIKDNLEKIYDKLEKLGNRPSWPVAFILTLLSSGFIAFLVMTVRGR